MVTFRSILLFFLFAFSSSLILENDPKSVWGKPKSFDSPEDVPGLENKLDEQLKMPWIVVSDRDNNITLTSAGGGDIQKTINFRDWFYVVDVQGGWIRIGKADLEGKDGKKIVSGTYQDYGWIEKSKMLLWTNSLVNATTKIHKKAFLLNKVEDINNILKLKNEKDVKVYPGPVVTTSGMSKTIYEFYFVYKYDSKSEMYLLGKDDRFGTRTIDDKSLIGWVERRRVTAWDTRLALEPNPQAEAFEERKGSRTFHVCAYNNQDPAENHAVQGVRDERSIYWDKDPVQLTKKEYLAQSDPKRFKGSVVRFPLLGCQGGRYYRTGVVGEITYQTAKNELQKMDEVYYSHLTDQLRKKQTGKDNYDILLVIEGTKNLGEYREGIIQGIKKIKEELDSVSVVRFGVSIYRDIPEEARGKLHTFYPFDQNIDKVAKFLNESEFARWDDDDSWTSMYYGIHEGFRSCNINSANTNIVILVGNFADFSGHTVRRESHPSHKASISDNLLATEMSKQNVHFIGIQVQNAGDRCAKKFQEQTRNLITQSAITQFQVYKDASLIDSKLDLGNPMMPELESGNELVLENGSTFGLLRKPNSNYSLSAQELTNTMQTAAKRVYRKVEGVWDKLRLVVEEGASFNDVNPGDFAEPMLNVFAKLKSEGKLSDDDIKKIVSRKYKLYAEVFMPRHIKDAKYPTCSIVLLMPAKDMMNYLAVLRNLVLVVDRPPDEQRDALYNTFVELVGQYVGNSKKPDQISVDELRQTMQGIDQGSCDLPSRWGDIRIADIRNKKKMNDEEIRRRIGEIVTNTSKLQSIANEGRRYEFSYATDNEVYFWIPLEYTF